MNIAFSFDDGRSDAYNAYKILSDYNLKATFHITTGFIDGTFKTDVFGKNRQSLTIEQINEIAHKMEISSHGDKHIMEKEDLFVSIDKLKKWTGNLEKIGFSVPNSAYDDCELKKFIDETSNAISYYRVGRNIKCYTLLNKINYMLYKIFKLQFAYNAFNKYNLIFEKENIIYSVVVKKNTNVKSIVKFINKYKQKKCTLVLMFHSIVDNPSDTWEWSTNSFKILCEFVSNEKNTNNILLREL